MKSEREPPKSGDKPGHANPPAEKPPRSTKELQEVRPEISADQEDEQSRGSVEAEQESPERTGELLQLAYGELNRARTDEELQKIAEPLVSELLAQHREESRIATARVSVERAVLRTWKRIAILVAAGVVLATIAIAVQLRPENEVIPDELVGLWTTSQPNYSDQAFRITQTSLTFHTSAEDSTFGTLTWVSSRRVGIARLFSVRYLGPDGEDEFFFYYVPADKVIRFRDQPESVWVKAQDSTGGGTANRPTGGLSDGQ